MKTQEVANIDIFGNQTIVKHERHIGTTMVNLSFGLMFTLIVVFGLLTLAVVSALGWLYGVWQNGVVSGFPQRSSSA